MQLFTIALAVAGALIDVGCGGDTVETGSTGPLTESVAEPPTARAEDREAGVAFELNGDTLRLKVSSGAPQSTRRILEGKVNIFCGTPKEFGPYGASAHSSMHRLPTDQSEFEVRLSKDVSERVGFCGIEGHAGGEIYGLFVPLEELLDPGSP